MLNERELQQEYCIEQLEIALERVKKIKGRLLSVTVLIMEDRDDKMVLTKIGSGFKECVIESLLAALKGGF